MCSLEDAMNVLHECCIVQVHVLSNAPWMMHLCQYEDQQLQYNPQVLLSGLQRDTMQLTKGDLNQILQVTVQGCSTKTWDLQKACLGTT